MVGTESAIVNAVAHEPCLKIVLLSHSSNANLTRDWHHTIALETQNLPCFPCHQIHADGSRCYMPTGFAACQDAARPEMVLDMCQKWLNREEAA